MSLIEIIESMAAAGTIGVLLPFSPLVRRWYNRAGATNAELLRTYSDDQCVPHPRQEYTRAITIHAPASQVWAYLIQWGQERAGMYSYDLLENIAGCQMHTVDHIVPEWQTIQVGDAVRFGPKGKGYPLLKVLVSEQNRSLVLVSADNKTEQILEPTDPMPAQYIIQTIAYYLEPTGTAETRLIVRSRLDYTGGFRMFLLWRVTEVLNYVMEHKMLRSIKQYAERDARIGKLQPA